MKTKENSRTARIFSSPVGSVLIAILLNMLWGCAFPFIKSGYPLMGVDSGNLPAILVFAGTRFTVSGICVLLIGSILYRRPLTPPKGKLGVKIIGLGLWQTALQYLFYYTAVANLTGKTGSVLNATQSFMAVLLAHFLYGKADRMNLRKALGCTIGFCGVVVACLSPDNGGTPIGIITMLLASAVFACSSPMNKALCAQSNGFTVAGWNLLSGGAVLLIVGLLSGGRLAPTSPLAFADLAALCFISGAGFTMNTLLLRYNPVSRVAVFGLCIPITTNLVSALLFPGSYVLGPIYLLALAMVCIGIWFVTRPGRAAAEAHS